MLIKKFNNFSFCKFLWREKMKNKKINLVAALTFGVLALAGGSVGKGAIYGTAIGAGLGLAKGVADKGESVEIPSNATIQVYFDQPITSAAPQGSY